MKSDFFSWPLLYLLVSCIVCMYINASFLLLSLYSSLVHSPMIFIRQSHQHTPHNQLNIKFTQGAHSFRLFWIKWIVNGILSIRVYYLHKQTNKQVTNQLPKCYNTFESDKKFTIFSIFSPSSLCKVNKEHRRQTHQIHENPSTNQWLVAGRQWLHYKFSIEHWISFHKK